MPGTEPQPLFYAVWATAWGPIGAVTGTTGLRRLVLPHYPSDQLAQVLTWEHPGAQRDERPLEMLIQLSRDYFNAKPVDFGQIVCELPSPSTLGGLVLRACRAIPHGQTRTYGSLAEQIGRPDSARAVAAALGRNPIPLVIPCHRVVYAGGRLGGFSAEGGAQLKQRMLDMERKAAPPPT